MKLCFGSTWTRPDPTPGSAAEVRLCPTRAAPGARGQNRRGSNPAEFTSLALPLTARIR